MTLLPAARIAEELFLPSPRTVETWAARGHLQSYGGEFLLEEAIEVEARLRRRPRRAALLALALRAAVPLSGQGVRLRGSRRGPTRRRAHPGG